MIDPEFQDGPTIPANRHPGVPEAFLTLADANAFARWSFFCGLFVGWVSLAAILSLAAVLT